MERFRGAHGLACQGPGRSRSQPGCSAERWRARANATARPPAIPGRPSIEMPRTAREHDSDAAPILAENQDLRNFTDRPEVSLAARGASRACFEGFPARSRSARRSVGNMLARKHFTFSNLRTRGSRPRSFPAANETSRPSAKLPRRDWRLHDSGLTPSMKHDRPRGLHGAVRGRCRRTRSRS